MDASGNRSLWLHGGLAITLMLLFFALGVAAIVGLTVAGIELFSLLGEIRAGRSSIWLIIGGAACFVAAAVLLWSLLPRIDRFEAPGPELDAAAQPQLFAEIAAIASATGQAPPAHVYAVLDMNAFVTERGGVMGIGSRRVMGLGIPLMQLLTVAELRAVIAHEFGHFHGGDTKIGPWVYKTRGALGRAVDNLTGVAQKANDAELGVVTWMMLAIRKPFIWFGKAYMRITQAVSRSQEIAADALACRVVGSEPLASGLQKSAGGGLGFQIYLREEVSPMLSGGVRPPVVDGFTRFVAADAMQTLMKKVAENELEDGTSDPYDSHPPLRQRVDAARALAAPTLTPDDRPAIVLLHDATALEDEALSESVRKLPRVGWDEAIMIIRKSWREHCEQWSGVLAGLTADALPFDIAALRGLLAKTEHARAAHQLDDDDVRGWATSLYNAALGERLCAKGYLANTGPGEPVMFTRDDDVTFNLALKIGERFRGETDAATWAAWITSLGLAGEPLEAT